MLAEAKSEFEYAQHLPKYPERARALADKAQHDAEAALRVAHTFVRPAPAPAALPPPRARTGGAARDPGRDGCRRVPRSPNSAARPPLDQRVTWA